MLEFKFTLSAAVPSEDGKQVEPGKPGSNITAKVFMFGKDYTEPGVTPERVLTQVCRIQDALLGTGDEGNPKGKPTRPPSNDELVPQLIGKEIVAKVRVSTSKDGQYTNNDFAAMYFPGDMPNA